jgi:hypothetical protein
VFCFSTFICFHSAFTLCTRSTLTVDRRLHDAFLSSHTLVHSSFRTSGVHRPGAYHPFNLSDSLDIKIQHTNMVQRKDCMFTALGAVTCTTACSISSPVITDPLCRLRYFPSLLHTFHMQRGLAHIPPRHNNKISAASREPTLQPGSTIQRKPSLASSRNGGR